MLVNERLDTFSDKEKERINDSDKKSKMNALVMKYGRSRVRKVSDESEREVKKTGKKLSWEEFKKRLEKSKEKTRLRPGEVKKWDPDTQKWVSNKDAEEEVNESVYGDGHDYTKGVAVTGRVDFGKDKKPEYDVGLSYKGNVLARKTRIFDKKERTTPEKVLDRALIDLKNSEDPAKNLSGMKK